MIALSTWGTCSVFDVSPIVTTTAESQGPPDAN
jgi:hypothetical protein